MAPLLSLLTLLAFALSTVVASPHIARHVYDHAHRAVALPAHLEDNSPSLNPQKRRRSLNRRCSPQPANTTSAYPSPSAPINVAPVPSSAASSHASYTPASSSQPPASSSQPPASSSQAPSPTSAPPAPSSTAPPPSSSPAPSPTSSSTPPPAQTSSSSSDTSTSGEPSFMTGTQSGQGTYYAPGLGACGITSASTDLICAVSEDLFDSYPGYDGVNPNDNPVCGKQITANYGGVPVTVTVVDRCTGCQLTDLDFSPTAFQTMAALTLGRIDISWVWS